MFINSGAVFINTGGLKIVVWRFPGGLLPGGSSSAAFEISEMQAFMKKLKKKQQKLWKHYSLPVKAFLNINKKTTQRERPCLWTPARVYKQRGRVYKHRWFEDCGLKIPWGSSSRRVVVCSFWWECMQRTHFRYSTWYPLGLENLEHPLPSLNRTLAS